MQASKSMVTQPEPKTHPIVPSDGDCEPPPPDEQEKMNNMANEKPTANKK
jgi:hypothetical protein